MRQVTIHVIIGLLVTFSSHVASGQTAPTVAIEKKNGKIVQVDELSNVYFVDKKNGITKYDAHNDSMAFFQTVANGPIGAIDVTDPMRVLVYYPNFNKVLVLDRMLSLQNTITLKLLDINQPTAIATTKDGGFWVYDYSQYKLVKLDRNYRVSAVSNDLRVALEETPRFDKLLERENELWALSNQNEVYIFTRFGEFVNKIPLATKEAIISLQRVGDQMIFATRKNIYVQHLATQELSQIDVSRYQFKSINGVVFTQEKVYLLSEQGVLTVHP